MHLTGDTYIDALAFTRKVANVDTDDCDAATKLAELVALARRISPS